MSSRQPERCLFALGASGAADKTGLYKFKDTVHSFSEAQDGMVEQLFNRLAHVCHTLQAAPLLREYGFQLLPDMLDTT